MACSRKKKIASICFRTAANAHVGGDFFVYCADWPFLSIFARKGQKEKCSEGAKKGSPDLVFWLVSGLGRGVIGWSVFLAIFDWLVFFLREANMRKKRCFFVKGFQGLSMSRP